MSPRVSIIIVTWNARALLERFLPSVVATQYPNLQIVVADNASTDGSPEWVERTFPNVTVVRHPENWRFCRGNNEAIAHTEGEYVVLLNNDVEVTPHWLDPLVRAMEADEDVAAVQPKIRQVDKRDHFEYAGASGGFIDAYGYPFARGRLFGNLERDEGQYDDPRDIFWGSGAALMLRRSAIEDVGLLDERLEMHMEEIDLCWRFWRAGWRVRVEPRSRVYHLGGGSLPQGNPQKVYYNFRNSFLLLYKHLPPRIMARLAPRRYALDTLAGLRALASGRPAELAAIVRAHRDFRRMQRMYTPPADGDDHIILPSYGASIVIDYYLRGHRTFQSLPRGSFAPGWH